MEKKKFIPKENTGNLFHGSDVVVVRKGLINIGGEEKYAQILKYSSKDQPDKFELSISAGLLKKVSEEDRQEAPNPETCPDIKGLINFNKTAFDFAGWRNVSEMGTEYTKVKLKKAEFKVDKKISEEEEKAPF